MASIHEVIQKEIDVARLEFAAIQTKAAADLDLAKAKIDALETKFINIPNELSTLAEAEAIKVWSWIKSL